MSVTMLRSGPNLDCVDPWRHRVRERREVMMNVYVMLGGIAVFVVIIAAMDAWTRRQDRRRKEQTDRPS